MRQPQQATGLAVISLSGVSSLDGARISVHTGAMTSSTIWLGAASILGLLVSLGLEIALLIIAVAVVRKHRPENWGWFAGAACIQLLGTISHAVLGWGGSVLMSRTSGVERMMMFNAATSLFYTLLSTTATFLLLYGIMRLAKPSEVPFPNS